MARIVVLDYGSGNLRSAERDFTVANIEMVVLGE